MVYDRILQMHPPTPLCLQGWYWAAEGRPLSGLGSVCLAEFPGRLPWADESKRLWRDRSLARAQPDSAVSRRVESERLGRDGSLSLMSLRQRSGNAGSCVPRGRPVTEPRDCVSGGEKGSGMNIDIFLIE
jgi:hypothetical protein